MRAKFVLYIFIMLAILSMLAGCGSTAQGKVVDEVMQHMTAHDSAAAFEHMSKVARDSGVTAEGMAAFIEEYPILVDGYSGMSVSSMNVSTSGSESTTEMNGTFSYSDGTSGQFAALLHKEGDVWFVTELNITK